MCFLDEVNFGCTWLWWCLVWELSENNVTTKYKFPINKKTKYVMREKPSCVKIIEYNEQVNILKLLIDLFDFSK